MLLYIQRRLMLLKLKGIRDVNDINNIGVVVIGLIYIIVRYIIFKDFIVIVNL